MNKIVQILMQRDKMTREEAEELVNEVRNEAFDNLFEADDIMLSMLSLEPDYLMDLFE